MRRIILSINLFFLFIFTSCFQNVNLNPVLASNSESAIVTVKVDGYGSGTKTALPTFDYSQITYYVYAKNESGTQLDSVDNGSAYQLLLTPGDWTVYAEGTYNGTLISKGTNTVSVAAGGQYSVMVSTNLVTTGNGDVKLKVAGFQWNGTDGEIRYKFDEDAADFVLNVIPGEDYGFIEKTGLTTGMHEVSLSYYAVSDTGKFLLFRAREIINVLPSLTTDTWNPDSKYVSGVGNNSVFTITTDILKILQTTTFYVSDGTGELPAGDDNQNRDYTGSYTIPFQSVETAFNRIKTVFPGSTQQFIIYVDGTGTFTGNFDIESGMNIKIASYSSSRQAVFDAGLASGYQIIVKNNAELTLENVTIQKYGADSKGEGEGAVLVKKNSDSSKNGKLIIEGKCIINNNSDSGVNDNVFLEDGCKIFINGLVTGSKIGIKTETLPQAVDSPVYFTSGFSNAYKAGVGDKGSEIFSSDVGFAVGTLNVSESVYEVAVGFSGGNITYKVCDDVKFVVSKNYHLYGNGDTILSVSVYVNDELYSGNDCAWSLNLSAPGAESTSYSSATNTLTIPSLFPEGNYFINIFFTYHGVVYSDTAPLSCFREEILDLPTAPTGGTIEIKSQEALSKIREWSANGQALTGVTIKLERDLVVTDLAPMGHSTAFNGTFDGNGKSITINSFSSTYKGSQGYGLFYQLSSSGKIQNLTIKGDINVNDYCAPFVSAMLHGSIENCINECNITSTKGAAGFVMQKSGAFASFVIQNCINRGKINGRTGAGGLAVSANNTKVSGRFMNCANEGSVISSNGLAGGFCDTANQCYFVNCYNQGDVTAGKQAGGIAGSQMDSQVAKHGFYNLYNKGKITGVNAAGGIVGLALTNSGGSGFVCIKNACNYGLVVCDDNTKIGCIIGAFTDSSDNTQKELESNYYLKDCAGTGVTGFGIEVTDGSYCDYIELSGTDYRDSSNGNVVGRLNNYVTTTLSTSSNSYVKIACRWKKDSANNFPIFDN